MEKSDNEESDNEGVAEILESFSSDEAEHKRQPTRRSSISHKSNDKREIYDSKLVEEEKEDDAKISVMENMNLMKTSLLLLLTV